MYHHILERQIKKFIGEKKIPEYLLPFLQAVSTTYTHADEDQKLLERSLNISSREMGETNARLIEEKKFLEDRTNQLEVTNNVMIGREIKMVELKKTIEQLKAKLPKESKLSATNPSVTSTETIIKPESAKTDKS